jgi:diguanylate cyclase (GGDEF)-like protein/PAS domain S-box-containing protein
MARAKMLLAVMPLAVMLLSVVVVLFASGPAKALEIVDVAPSSRAIELTREVDSWPRHGDRLQVSTAPGADGIVRRIEVRAREMGQATSWVVLALANNSNEQLDRILVAPHFLLSSSGVFRPDLGQSRIVNITPSQGFRPEREPSADADIYRLTLDPGAVVTYVIELSGPALPQLRLWQDEAYKDTANSLTLYHGMVLGISGLLALFLTVLFVVRGTLMFPVAAGVGWAVLAYLCVDFGFWERVFRVEDADNRVVRAAAEVMITGSLALFLTVYLFFDRWRLRMAIIIASLLLVVAAAFGIALIDPALAAGFARFGLALVGIVGIGLVIFNTFQGLDRAILMVPTWILLLGWIWGGFLVVSGQIDNDLAAPALNGGLVLLVLLIGLTVMQHAFAGAGISSGILPDLQRKAFALMGSGDFVFDWDIPRDRLFVGSEVSVRLGLNEDALLGALGRFLDTIHVADQDRIRVTLETMVELRRGRVAQDLRLRAADGHYTWFRLKARPILGADGEIQRVVGTLTDITDSKTAEERLLQDAVHDNLTGLPNRELFADRLAGAVQRAENGGTVPSVIFIDIDKFRQVNDGIGIAGGDSVLLTISRRLQRLIQPQDTLARISGDQFGLLLLSETELVRVKAVAESISKAIRVPMTFGDRELFLTCSQGIATFNDDAEDAPALFDNAEIALNYAKRMGQDYTETYRTLMRSVGVSRLSVSSELKRSVERGEIRLVYQPIVNLGDRRIAGFEALARWDHPRYGSMPTQEFIQIAEENGVIIDIGMSALDSAAKQTADWQKRVGNDRNIFTSVNISTPHLFRHDLITDVKSVIARNKLKDGQLKLELTESIVMENPEHAAKIMNRLRESGAGLAMDDFGTGYSSLSYLQKLPFDTLKVDHSFVRETGNGARPLILKSIIGLAHDLKMKVIAEGAESDRDASELAKLGCEFAQGFYFGRPMSASDATRLLAYNVQNRQA